MKSLKLYWNKEFGFTGERVVAEELNQLLTLGWRAFHVDMFNVDHVAVEPIGVFAVETKATRKWKDRATAHEGYKVKRNGRQLTWPSGAKNELGLAQAERNAKTVADFLSKASGERTECTPVLTLPGLVY